MENDPYFAPLHHKRQQTVPQKEGTYIVEKDGSLNKVEMKATLMGLLVTDGPFKGKTATELGVARWSGPFTGNFASDDADVLLEYIRNY